ncbi:MAG TPA: DUF2239 family protein [Paludibaculum sp.]|jgi:hypothetical protein
MSNHDENTCTAFEGADMIATGALPHVAKLVKQVLDRGERAPVLIFDDETSEPVELDFRGTWEEVAARLPGASQPPRGPGRPKLGVLAREVTLLPRHWEWLSSQPGGASVALRRLVEQARRTNAGKDQIRQGQEAAYRFLSAIAGNLPGFEEACRALFAGDARRFDALLEPWPEGLRTHARRLATRAFPNQGEGARHGS